MTFQNFFRLFFVFVFCFVFLASYSSFAESVETKAKQVILLDYETGTVLFEKNADERMPTSSMSKVMTMYLVFDALKSGKISLQDEFIVSEKAWRMGGSKMFVPVNEKIKIEDLVRGVVIQSGNDAAIVLAEGLAGSETSFAAALNKKAAELGMNNSHFMNASGWPDPDHYSTARDLSILSRHLIQDFPDYYPYFSEKEFKYHDIKQGNRNPLLYRDIGADGIKTGHTEDGGYGLMASGVEDGRRVILVMNGMSSQQERADESARLLQWGLSGFSNIVPFRGGVPIEDADVVMGQLENVPLVIQDDITVTVPKLFQDDFRAEITYDTPLVAPLVEGDKVGVLRLLVPGSMNVREVPLLVGEDVPELGYFAKTLAKIKYLTSSKKDAAKEVQENVTQTH